MDMDNSIIALLALPFGLIIGSFLSVCIYRIPLGKYDREGNTLDPAEVALQKSEDPVTFLTPRRSLCPHCRKQLEWWHNIPVLSWLLLGGKCSFCSAGISVRYPFIELMTGFFAWLSVTQFGTSPTALVVFLFTCALIVITFIDYDYFIIPNVITYPGAVIGLVLAGISQWTSVFQEPVTHGFVWSLLGVLAGGGFLLLVSEVYLRLRKIEGLGLGDVKLLTMTGACFGPECSLYTIFIGSLAGSLLGITMVLLSGRRMTQHLPFGPYLAFGTVLYLFTGNTVLVKLSEFITRLLTGS